MPGLPSWGAIVRVGPLEPLACDQPAILADAVLEQIRPARAGCLAELMQEAGRCVAPARRRDQPFRAVTDGLEHGVAAAQVALGRLTCDRSCDDPGRCSKRLGLGGAPVALVFGVLESDEAPPAALDEDRHGQNRERACECERFTLVLRQVADVAADDVAAAEHLDPAREVGGSVDVCEPGVVDRRIAPAGIPARDPASVRRRLFRSDVLEDVRARDARGLAEDAHQLDDSFVEASLNEKALGGAADGLEDRVAAAQVVLGEESLFACPSAGEDNRELAGDVDQAQTRLRFAPLARTRRC